MINNKMGYINFDDLNDTMIQTICDIVFTTETNVPDEVKMAKIEGVYSFYTHITKQTEEE